MKYLTETRLFWTPELFEEPTMTKDNTLGEDIIEGLQEVKALDDFRASTERMHEYDFEELMAAFQEGWKARDKQESK